MKDNKILDVTVYINKTHSFITLYCKYVFCFMFNFLVFLNFCSFSERKVTRVNIVLVFLTTFYHFLKIYAYYNAQIIWAEYESFQLIAMVCGSLWLFLSHFHLLWLIVFHCVSWWFIFAYCGSFWPLMAHIYSLLLILTLCGSKWLLVTPCRFFSL